MAPHPVAAYTLTHTQDPTTAASPAFKASEHDDISHKALLSTQYSLLSIIGGVSRGDGKRAAVG